MNDYGRSDEEWNHWNGWWDNSVNPDEEEPAEEHDRQEAEQAGSTSWNAWWEWLHAQHGNAPDHVQYQSSGSRFGKPCSARVGQSESQEPWPTTGQTEVPATSQQSQHSLGGGSGEETTQEQEQGGVQNQPRGGRRPSKDGMVTSPRRAGVGTLVDADRCGFALDTKGMWIFIALHFDGEHLSWSYRRWWIHEAGENGETENGG